VTIQKICQRKKDKERKKQNMNFIFDIDDTLYDQKDTFVRAFEKIFGTASGLPVEELFVCSRELSGEGFAMVRRGELTPQRMYAYRIAKAFTLCCGKHLDEDQALAFQTAYRKEQDAITMLPGIAALLEELTRRRQGLGILTNGPGIHQRCKYDLLGAGRWIAPQRVFISEEIGAEKPDAAAFRCVEKALAITPEETVYIGDAFDKDICGAKGAGWKAVWINRRGAKLPEDALWLPDAAVFDDAALIAALIKMLAEEA
jgi:putative hydrolase of the HAD superfamily